ncbi:hypothetical protein BO79DRAFT_217033 [Aspergillus costaricaensis CBS 115574]|uniref:Uncharacterized protein n=1 Tax=Aspergillus costaricaensis CBS 115574 TaxID=1448317 RepID=A0ACD1IIH7_9EURO|nr:hypothetical protein BO79DRAFT_217033 [Aspergillus costaricaensis CBS 115574]RAK89567.1 hypothetical protein BO79DRAFT_217033 [Aspergillus costaricaensis CBS 115574]
MILTWLLRKTYDVICYDRTCSARVFPAWLEIEAMNKLIKDAEASKQVHKTLQANVTSMKSQANVTSMKSQAKELSDLIDPAKQAIETLEGGWDVMGTEVQYIHDKDENFVFE